MKFIQTHSMGSDCTAPYDITDYKAKTVREFIDELMKECRNEWGDIEVRNKNMELPFGRQCMFNRGKLITQLPEELLDLQIQEVKCSGGWGAFDYIIFTK